MTMVPLSGLVGSAAGVPLSQSKGNEPERAQKDQLRQARELDAAQTAENAAGIGQTEQDQESSERDADGRRLWERPANGKPPMADSPHELRQSKDATGQAGNNLDLTG